MDKFNTYDLTLQTVGLYNDILTKSGYSRKERGAMICGFQMSVALAAASMADNEETYKKAEEVIKTAYMEALSKCN